jgi:hypothetical protein
VTTKLKANTLAVDPKTHKVYLPSATVEGPTATPENPHPAVTRVPGTFKILVLSK